MRPLSASPRLAALLLLIVATGAGAASIPTGGPTSPPATSPAPPTGASPLRTLGGGIT